MANPRIYYPIHAVAFSPLGMPYASTGWRAAKGVQSVSFTTSFNLEQVYELGQIELYENIENLPNIEMQVTKVLDGYSLLQHLATPGATVATLAGRYNDNRCSALVSYYSINNSFATGIPLNTVIMSGLYVSSLGFNMPVQGNMTENLTLVGNNKYFITPGQEMFAPITRFTGSDTPVLASGGVQRRENMIMLATGSYFPSTIPGLSVQTSEGTTGYYNPAVGTSYGAHIQDISIACNLGRTELFEQGTKGPYHRFANFPVEVTTTISVTASEEGDNVDAYDDRDNLINEWIRIKTTQGVIIDLGKKNKLANVTSNGGDTGGGNVTIQYSYANYNFLNCVFPAQDPAVQQLP